MGRRNPSVRRVPCTLLASGLALVALSLALTLFDVRPAAPFLAGLSGFALILTAILSLEDA